jgi:hypothetical protein
MYAPSIDPVRFVESKLRTVMLSYPLRIATSIMRLQRFATRVSLDE